MRRTRPLRGVPDTRKEMKDEGGEVEGVSGRYFGDLMVISTSEEPTNLKVAS